MGHSLQDVTECSRLYQFTIKTVTVSNLKFTSLLRLFSYTSLPLVHNTIMAVKIIFLVLIIAISFDLSQTRNLPENLTGTCTCTVNISNQQTTYVNDCSHRFEPSSEVLVMPMHPGTGSPRMKARCICKCQLNLRGGSHFWRLILHIQFDLILL